MVSIEMIGILIVIIFICYIAGKFIGTLAENKKKEVKEVRVSLFTALGSTNHESKDSYINNEK